MGARAGYRRGVPRPTRAALTAALMWLAGPWAHAEWRVVAQTPPDAAEAGETAQVENPAGHRLRIYRAEDGSILGLFTLRDGFDVLAEGVCPTLRVDDGPARVVGLDRSRCRNERRRVRFSLGRVEDGRVHSTVLVQLMRGTTLRLRYPLKGLGYGESTFTLTGSRGALRRALGPGVTVVPE